MNWKTRSFRTGCTHAPVRVALILALAAGMVAAEELRSFRDREGREIKAAIVGGTAATVTITMENGQEYTLPHSKFSDADQEFIRNWVKENPVQIRYHFDINAVKKRVDKRKRETVTEEITEEDWVYLLEITNRSSAAVSDLEVQYRIYTTDGQVGKNEKKPVRTAAGNETVSLLKRSRGAEVTTRPVSLTLSDLRGDYEYLDGSDDKKHDRLEGIWVKLFHNGKKVAEYKGNDVVVKQSAWPDSEQSRSSSASE